MNKKPTTMGQLAAKLSNNKMVKVVASLFHKESFDLTDEGSIELSEEEEERIRKTYGEAFLTKLKATNFSEEGAAKATDLFDEAVRNAAEELAKDKDKVIADLRATVEQLAGSPEPAPQAKTPAGAAGEQLAAIDMKARHNAVVAAALASGNPFSVQLTSQNVDVSELNAEFAIAMPPKLRLEILLKRIYQGFNDAKFFTPVNTNTDFIASAAIHTEVSQQFTPEWTPKGSLAFTPIRIEYRRHKINEAIKPADLLSSWLLYLYEQGKSQAEQPFVRYVVTEHILPKVLEDITLSMIAKGKYNAVNVGSLSPGATGSAAKDSMDGIETILVEGKAGTNTAAKKINFYKNAQNVLTMTDEQAHAYIDAFADAVRGQFVNKQIEIHCAPEVLTKYQRAEFKLTGVYTGKENDGSIRFTSAILVPMESMYNSPILFVTPKENMKMLVDLSHPENCINDIQKENYDVKIFGEYSLAVGFAIAEAVFASVPDGYTPYNAVRNEAQVDSAKWTNGGSSSGSGAGSGSGTGSSTGSGSGSGEGTA